MNDLFIKNVFDVESNDKEIVCNNLNRMFEEIQMYDVMDEETMNLEEVLIKVKFIEKYVKNKIKRIDNE